MDHGDAEALRLVGREAVERHELAAQRHRPAGRGDDAGHDVEQCRLAGAVLADERVDLTAGGGK